MKGREILWCAVLLACGFSVSGQNFNCNFEGGFCFYFTNDVRNNYNSWTLGRGNTKGGPAIDHTYGNSTGAFAFVNVPRAMYVRAGLLTNWLMKDYCVTFWYYMFGSQVGTLSVNVRRNYYQDSQIFTRTGSQGDRWKQSTINIKYSTYNSYFRLVFLLIDNSYRFSGDVALDDIVMNRGTCPSAAKKATDLCTFDNDNCGFKVTQKGKRLSWNWSGGVNKLPRMVPNADHTLGTNAGHHWYASASKTSSIEKAILSSPTYNPPKVSPSCLHFYYYMDADATSWWWGPNVKQAVLQVYVNYNQKGKVAWEKNRDNTRHKEWAYAEAKIEATSKYQVDFLFLLESNTDAALTLDDVRLVEGDCPEAGFCNFEDGLCMWENRGGDISWLREKGNALTTEKGPESDKTKGTGDGYYMFVSTSNKSPNLKARLESEPMQPTDKPSCVFFWYYMYSYDGDAGILRVLRSLDNITESSLWSLEGTQGSAWREAKAPALSTDLGTQIIFEATTGNQKSTKGYIAIDDVRIRKNEKCQLYPSNADPKYDAQRKIQCSFDNFHFCNWKQKNDTPNAAMWQFGNATSLESTGPLGAFGGRGHYIFVSSYESDAQNQKVATLQSPLTPSFYPDTACFNFYYYMFGAHVGELRVVIVAMKNSNNILGRQVVWRRKGTQPDKWIKFQDNLNVTEGNFKIEIEADGGTGFAGHIAIDEIKMQMGPCVNQEYACDFESSTCGWTVEASKPKGSFYWFQGANLTKGPNTDHTTLTSAGSSLQAVFESGVTVGETTNLVSSKFGRYWGKHCLTFWYYRPGFQTGKITVLTRNSKKEETQQWAITSDVGRLWHSGQTTLNLKESFRILIHAEKGKSDDNQMAIDDIAIKNKECDSPAYCDFNVDYCSYSMNSSSDFAWQLGTGRVVNSQIIDKPPSDIHDKNGMFLYVDMTSPNLKENQQAVLVSEILDVSSTKYGCLKFYYYLDGIDSPTFSVGFMFLNNMEKDMTYEIIEQWNTKSPTSKLWKSYSKTFAVPQQAQNMNRFQFYFKAVRGKGPNGIIALDQISYFDGQCEVSTVSPPTVTTEMPTSDLSCSFDDNTFCKWSVQATKVNWKISTPRKTSGNMPRYDHTYQNYNGRYAYFMGDGVSPKTATMQSPSAPATWGSRFCFSFWYIMNTDAKSSSSLSLKAIYTYSWRTTFVTLWRRVGFYGNRWRHAYVYHTSRSGTNPKLNFTAEAWNGVIAIDDLAAQRGVCPPSKLCTFDGQEDMCDFIQDSKNTQDWNIKTGDDSDVVYEMPDHTMKQTSGKFLYVNFNASDTSQKARIFTPRRSPDPVPSCVTFYYHVYNISKFALNTYISTSNGLSEILWAGTKSQGLLWHGARFTAVSKSLKWQVMFEAEAAKGGYGQVALDDISVDKGACPDSGNCDFEKENCLWENARDPYGDKTKPKDASALFYDDIDWVRHVGEDYFGPPLDNTMGSPEGFYLLLDTRYATPNQKAVIISERLQSVMGSCFKFWYAIPNVPNAAQLKIYTSSDFIKTKEVQTFTKSTNEEWERALVSIIPEIQADIPLVDYWILVAGYVGNSTLGYVAVDDFSITEGECDEQTKLFDCKNGQHILAKFVCNFRNDCTNGLDEANCSICDFENGTCGWSVVYNFYDSFKWTLSSAGKEGLEYDHTKQDSSGHFMVAATTGSSWRANSATSLKSTVLRDSFSTCNMEFWYSVMGEIDLAVQVKRNNISTEIWVPEGKSPYVWTKGEVLLGRIARTFELIFYASTNKPRVIGKVAIDDVAMPGCETPANDQEGYCPRNQFNCKNSHCIPMEKSCDFTDDCGNFEDEKKETCADAIYRCSFDQSFCEWVVDNSTSGRWTRVKPFSSVTRGPTRDHTTSTASGQFLYIGGRLNPSPARLLGPTLQPASGCQFRFYYDVQGNGPFSLKIKTRSRIGGPEKVVWSREDPTEGYFFVDESVTFSEWQSFQVIIEGSVTLTSGKANYIALDDVSFSKKCVPLITPLPTAPPPITSTGPPEITCKTDEFKCDKIQCINKTLVCDFKLDCSDGSDEQNCGECDFDTNMCGLVNTGTGAGYKWERKNAEDFSMYRNSTVPGTDSHQNAEGFFAALSSTTTSYVYYPAVMRTPALGELAASCKLEFYYHFNIRYGYLQVHINKIGGGTYDRIRKFGITSPTGKDWQFASVAIGNYPAGKVIEFHGKISYGRYQGVVQDIAVDNIKYVNCAIGSLYNKTLNCTFDEDDCGWHPDNKNNFMTWNRLKKSPASFGPQQDHTGRNGFFLALVPNFAYQGRKASLISAMQPPTEGRCISFWYHMFGQDVGTLNLIVQGKGENNYTAWSKTNSQGNSWKKAERTIRSKSDYNIIIEGVIGKFYRPILAIDDITVYEDDCPHPVECDFESDFCEWTADGWTLQTGKGKRPPLDHSTGTQSGQYVVLSEESGKLLSPTYNFSRNGHCLKFWYFIEGDRSTRLSVIKSKESADESKIQPTWSDYGEPNKTGEWYHAMANIDDLDIGPYIIRFLGIKSGPSAVVALDDVRLADGACPPYGSCTFEEDFCTWRNEIRPFSKLVWLRNSGKTPSKGSGPETDHTTGTPEGFYIYLDSNFGYSGQTAILESENLHYSPNACFKFWYHMTGRGVGSLAVQLLQQNGTYTRIVQLSGISGDQGKDWKLYKYFSSNLPDTFRLRLTGTLGNYFGGDIAVDDIVIQSNTCEEPVTTTVSPTIAPPSEWDCNFESGVFCNWKNGYAWVVQDGRRAISNNMGPVRDHTLGNAIGKYAYFHPLNDTGHDITSTVIDKEYGEFCFQFWYYMRSLKPISLSIFSKEENQQNGPLWLKKDSAAADWKKGSFHFQKYDTMNILIRPIKQTLKDGDIALDDFIIRKGACPVEKNQPCDFEAADICAFKLNSPDGITWKRTQASETRIGPLQDKSYGTGMGHYMMVRPSTTARVPGDNVAWLIIPNLPSTGYQLTCVKFWYQMTGDHVRSLKIYKRTPGGELPRYAQWQLSTKHASGRWRIGMSSVYALYVHDIVFIATLSRGDNGFIALDDIQVSDGRCPAPGSCDFEKDLCSWQNAENGTDIEWMRNTGSTPTNNTGPDFDHTSGTSSGSYVYLQGSESKRNLVGVLESEFFSLASNRCLTFWAHMYGDEMGSLYVNVSYFDGDQRKTLNEPLGNIEGNQNANWLKRQLTINAKDRSIHDEYQILFIGKTKGLLSDIALDDIEVTSGQCYKVPTTAFDCKDGTHVARSKVCDFDKDCPYGEDEAGCGPCDFEHGDCGWTDVSSYYYQKWKRVQGKVGNTVMGPGYDHTFNQSSGYFMLLQPSYYSYQQSTLQSPAGEKQFKKSYASCVVKFYYYHKRSSSAILQVRKRLGSSTIGTVWEQYGQKSEGWQLGEAELGTTERPFYVDFGLQVSYESTYVAIDDITFENCGLPPKKERCSLSEYRCNNGRCISRDLVCDMTDDCGDKTDESYGACYYYPMKCSFDGFSDCEWTAKGKRLNWTVVTSSSTRGKSNTGPIVDHTKGINGAGKYLLLKRRSSKVEKYNQSLYISPNYQIRRGYSCDLRFYYYMYGKDVATLKIYSEFEEGGWSWNTLWEKSGSLSQSWNRGVVKVWDRKPFHFIVEGILGNGTESAIALDDFSLTYGCLNYSKELPTPKPTELPVKKCKTNQFQCKNDMCIPSNQKCDFNLDCSDGSDELNCGPCDFEKDMCGWVDSSYGGYLWSRKNGTSDDLYGPKTGNGYFAYVKRGYNYYKSNTYLVSPMLPPTSTHCVMSFWFYLNGNNSGILDVSFKRNYYPYISVWSEKKPQGPQWNLNKIRIPANNAFGSRVRIGSSAYWNNNDKVRDVAIDEITFLNCNPKTLLVDCNFDDESLHDGFCFWTQTGKIKWQRSKGSTGKNFTGPSSDHSTGHGYYLFINQTNQLANRNARLKGPTLPMNYPQGSCFSFWYHMFGNHIGTLRIVMETKRFNTIRWSRTRNQGNKWLPGEAFIRSTNDFNLLVEAISRWGPQGNIAVDDFKLVDGPCSRTTTCDFSYGFCGWKTSFDGTSNWIRSQGSKNFTIEKPTVDHTSNTPYGYFIYLPRKRPNDLARLESPFYNNVGDICVKFWFNMFGDEIGTLAVYQRTKDEGRIENAQSLWMRAGNHDFVWKQGRVTLKALPSFYVAIEAQIGLQSTSGYIALDDIKITHGACSDPATCNFEIDTCGWTNNMNTDLDWVRRTGSDQNMGAGPKLDHSTYTMQGHYMYAYLSGQPANSSTSLISEDLPLHPTYCFSIWYNMYNAVNVSLYLEQMLVGMGWIGIEEFRGVDSSNEWYNSEVNITVENAGEFFSLALTVRTTNDISNISYAGVAVDDIILRKDSCGVDITTTVPPISTTPYPDTKFDCDFESGFCDSFWMNDDEVEGKWAIVTGHADKKLTRPRTDHTTRSTRGHYITLTDKAKSFYQYSKARLIAHDGIQPSTDGICFKFWYHMYGNNPGTLLLRLQNYDDTDKYLTVWSRTGSKGPSWNYEQVHINSTFTYKIVFEGTGTPNGDIALDDFSMNTKGCPPRDYCDVETDYCSFSNDPEATVPWQRGIGSFSSGPKFDHTYGTKYGTYFFVDTKKNITAGDTAILESSSYQPDKKCLRFWYYLYGSGSGTLEVYTRYGDTKTSRWKEVADNIIDWQGSEVVLEDNMNLPFTYAFKLTAGEAVENGTIGIDDIVVKDNCPHLGSCNFEEDMCMWTNVENEKMELRWIRGSGEVVDVGPDKDHTFGSQFGAYAYVSFLKYYTSANPLPAELKSPAFPPTKYRCVNFWSFRNGTNQPSLSVVMNDAIEDKSTTLLLLQYEKMGRWMNDQVQITQDDSSNQYHIIFVADLQQKENQFIALDDITVTDGNCSKILPEVPTFSCDNDETHISDDLRCDFYPDCNDLADESQCGQECDFETNEQNPCYWQSSSTYALSWNRTKSSEKREPNMDHTNMTTGEGYFMKLVNKQSYNYYSSSAELYSPLQIQSSSTCRLYFWYYISASYSGARLSVYFDAVDQNKITTIFGLNGNQGKVWKLGEAIIGRIVHRFRVGFSAYVSYSSQVIAIDDLKFEDCPIPRTKSEDVQCGKNEFKCKNNNCIPIDQVCDFADNCGDYSDENPMYAQCDNYPARCDFERSYCDWKRGENADYIWDRTTSKQRNYFSNVQVNRDHTKNSADGYFAYFSNSGYRTVGKVARLASPIMKANDKSCKLRFFYSYGTTFDSTDYDKYKTADLIVYVRYDEINVWDTLMNIKAAFGQHYEYASIDLGHIPNVFEVIIQSRIGATQPTGGWAIDDVSFTPGCSITNESLPYSYIDSTTAPPPVNCRNKFACKDGSACIELTKVCDFAVQCSDGSDESNCGSCSFDDDSSPICGWKDETFNRWVRQKGGNDVSGPKNDTSGNGYYLYVTKKNTGLITSQAVLKSVPLQTAASTCRVTFYYWMNGVKGNDAALKIQVQRPTGHIFTLWSESSDQGNSWKPMTVSVGSQDRRWQMSFIATHVKSKGDIAIDDIKFIDCSPIHVRDCANKNDFSCGGDKCIDRSLVCDFSIDCPDGSDEAKCGNYLERCDFEKGNMCGWTQDKTSSNKWNLVTGKEVVEGKGPNRDHTVGDETGHFLISKLTYSWYSSSAKITSVLFRADTSGDCKIRLWYHMLKENSGSLSVIIQDEGDTRKVFEYKINSTFGDQWIREETVLRNKVNFQVSIVGSPKYGSKGEIAIDDISFTSQCVPMYTVSTVQPPTIQPSGICEKNGEFSCGDNSCIPKSQVCDFKTDCPYGIDELHCPSSCDFEIGLTCGWHGITVQGDGVEIEVVTAEYALKIVPSYMQYFMPGGDKTTGSSSGKYLLIHTKLETETGPLDEYRSPNFSSSASTCKFQFWYAAKTSYFKPFVGLRTSSEEILDMLQISTTDNKKWVQATIGIGRQNSNFSVTVYKKGKINFYDFVAIDDLYFIDCALPHTGKDVCSGGFHCKKNKACIPSDLVCDLSDDCGDGSDEEDCSSQRYLFSDFEKGFGFFTPIKNNRDASLIWEIRSGSTPGHANRKFGPAFDHTLSSQSGHYLAITKGTAGSYMQKGWLASEVLSSTDGSCMMRFYYYMYGANVYQLNIYSLLKEGGNMTSKWAKVNEVGNYWERAEVVFDEKVPFKVIIEGKAGMENDDLIAVDDISFTPACKYVQGATLPPESFSSTTRSFTTALPTDCRADEFYCKMDKICIERTMLCDFRQDCSDGSDEDGCVQDYCNFQNQNMCGWKVSNEDKKSAPRKKRDTEVTDYRWRPIRADDPHTLTNLQYRPVRDHTLNSTEGWYLLADGAPGRSGDVTSLISTALAFPNGKCSVDFWLYCGTWACKVNLYYENVAEGSVKEKQLLWKAEDEMFASALRQWKNVRVPLNTLRNFRIRFDATRPYTGQSVMCLDDIQFTTCSPPPKVPPGSELCDSHQLKCDNQRCINLNLVCDFNDDCLDRSDEKFICSAYPARCDFEGGSCKNWRLESDKSNSWQYLTGDNSRSYVSVPAMDHTTFSALGKYLSYRKSYFTRNAKPKLVSDVVDGYAKDCKLRVWYASNPPSGKIDVYKRINYYEDGLIFIKSLTSTSKNFWERDEIDLGGGNKDFQVVFVPNVTMYAGSVSLDDLSMTTECSLVDRDLPGKTTDPPPIDECGSEKLTCKNKNCYTHAQRCNFIDDCGDNTDEANCGTNCNFENDFCGWFTPEGYATKWNRRRGKPYWYYDLDGDHTYKNKSGFYAMPVGFGILGNVAELHTATYIASGTECKFVMWYYQSGANAGKLAVRIKYTSSSSKQNDYIYLWETSGDQGKKWNKADVKVGKHDHFALVIESVYVKRSASTIAIDDLEFVTCASSHPPVECTSDQWMCKDKTKCINIWDYCNGQPECEDNSDEASCISQPGDCDFDSNDWMSKCKWTPKQLDFEWSRANASRSKTTGPPRHHHPRRQGYYLFIDSSKQTKGDVAAIATPSFKASQGKCHLRFWYYMKGSESLGKLTVLAESKDGQAIPMWVKAGPQEEKWLYGYALVGSSQDYSIIFEGTVGGDSNTDIAIDDVSFTSGCAEGGTAVVPTGKPAFCTNEEFMCRSGTQCVPKGWKCDCRRDCSDGSDESECEGTTCASTSGPREETTTPSMTSPRPTLPPIHNCDPGWTPCASTDKCIPIIYLCDSVEDCPDGSDEKHHCNDEICDPEYYYCGGYEDSMCIHRSKLCDGRNDCFQGSDEVLCGECRPDFCTNSGNCTLSGKVPVCSCDAGYTENRCAKVYEPPLQKKFGGADVAWIPGVVIATILIIAIVVTVWYKRNTNVERQRLPHAVDNPVYGLHLENLNFSEIGSQSLLERDMTGETTSIENPLYKFKTESSK